MLGRRRTEYNMLAGGRCHPILVVDDSAVYRSVVRGDLPPDRGELAALLDDRLFRLSPAQLQQARTVRAHERTRG